MHVSGGIADSRSAVLDSTSTVLDSTSTVLDSAVLDSTVLDEVDEAIAELRAGRPVVVIDDEDRENEGDLVMAAELVTAESLCFFMRWTSGLICAPLAAEIADRLLLPPMVTNTEDPAETAFTVSVDARDGIESGISAADRAHTLRLLADPDTRPDQLCRPGHMFPLRARPGGLAERRGHTEATVDLLRLAGLAPAGVLSEICNEDGSVARAPQLRSFADAHGLKFVSIEQVSGHARAAAPAS
jgi:3,4-dihydroxy 2-butanone 4-phosphate synthase / GTP cyclohydrolase II